MLHSNDSLFGVSSGSWDVSCGRKFLQIPESQLRILNSIPEWSTEIDTRNICEKEVQSEKVANSLILQDKVNSQKNQIKSSQESTKNSIATSKKESFFKKISLATVKKNLSTFCSFKRSNSLPNIFKQESIKILPNSRSEETLINRRKSMPTEIPLQTETASAKESVLEKTFIIPKISNDRMNVENVSEMNNLKYFSCPLEFPVPITKKSLEKLDEKILNHKYFTESISTVYESDFSEVATEVKAKHENLLNKKLLLLEKRLSPSKDIYQVRLDEKKSKALNNKESLKSSQIVTEQADEAALPEKAQSTDLDNEVQKLYKSAPPDEIMYEKDEAGSTKNNPVDTPLKATNISFEESFLTPPIPCGQPPAENVSPPSQINSSQKINNAAPIKSQNEEPSVKNLSPEKSSAQFSVFAENNNEVMLHSSASYKVSGKRKRKSRGEKSSKKLDTKNSSKADILFSADQIKDMIAIMKLFQADGY